MQFKLVHLRLKGKELSIAVPSTKNFNAITGKGVEATVEGKKILVVSPGYLKENNIPVPDGFTANDTETVVFVIINNELAGYIALSDEIRPESAEAIKTLKQMAGLTWRSGLANFKFQRFF